MTFSIVARSADGRSLGVAVASKYLAVGSLVAAARAGAGAVATQAMANLAYRPQAIAALTAGMSAQACVDALTGPDQQRDERQLGVVAVTGLGASYTGAACLPWAGGRTGEGYAIQGNILTGPGVVDAMQQSWLDGAQQVPLARHLLAALAAGDAAGGDRRGRQGAAVLVASLETLQENRALFAVPADAPADQLAGLDLECDLRVDDHPDPVTELARLLEVHQLYFGRTDEADLLALEGELAGEVARHLRALGYPGLPGLDQWAGVENFENRLHPGRIDPVVLAHLRVAARR